MVPAIWQKLAGSHYKKRGDLTPPAGNFDAVFGKEKKKKRKKERKNIVRHSYLKRRQKVFILRLEQQNY